MGFGSWGFFKATVVCILNLNRDMCIILWIKGSKKSGDS